jgi:hypothetical protein
VDRYGRQVWFGSSCSGAPICYTMTARSGFSFRRFYGASAALIRPSLREIGPHIENAQSDRQCAVARPCEIDHVGRASVSVTDTPHLRIRPIWNCVQDRARSTLTIQSPTFLALLPTQFARVVHAGLVSSLERVLFNYERHTRAALATSFDGNEAGLFEHTQSWGLRVGVNTQFPHHQVGNGETIGAS